MKISMVGSGRVGSTTLFNLLLEGAAQELVVVDILKERGYPEWVTRAILSHADYSGVARESRLEHALYACDEMSGFVTAAALVRPSKSVLDLEAASVMKRMKDKAFARAVSREDLRRGAEEIGLPLDQHIANVIAFMRERADDLGLRGSL